ncbi:MAG: hypothetical protein JXX14_15645, partial [Deltaproteobacteria bacterium]|nr:hypothetical protein [Deltaproteobacteria bacterium]
LIGGWGVVGGHWGTYVGIPIHIGDTGRNEARIGLGLEGGLVEGVEFGEMDEEGYSPAALGPMPSFEFTYHRHVKKHLSFQTGLALRIYPLQETSGIPPSVNLFAGITI